MDERVEPILELLMALAAGNLEARCEHSGSGDALDAILESINMLAEELQHTFTTLEETNRRLLEAERMTVLGQLCGGVAHELRNPLGALKNAAYFLGMALKDPEPEVLETLQIVNAEVATCERIIGNLLDYARPRDVGATRVVVDELLRQVLASLPAPDHVRVSLETPGPPAVVQGDPEQLAQVFGNIIRNAYQAMPRLVGPGELSIRVERTAAAGVSVAFTDSGEGIAEQHLAALFEPLFTTRAKGIGLGLAVSLTMVEQHGGTIEVRNEPRGGATFTVALPGRPPESNPSGGARRAPS